MHSLEDYTFSIKDFIQDDLKTIGARIRDLRLKKGYSQEELAKKVGYTSRSSITKIEKGLVDLQQSKIYEFSKIFGITPADLMGWDGLNIGVPDANLILNASITRDERYEDVVRFMLQIGKQKIDNIMDIATAQSIIELLQDLLEKAKKDEKS